MKSLSYFAPVAGILEAETYFMFSKVLKSKYYLKEAKEQEHLDSQDSGLSFSKISHQSEEAVLNISELKMDIPEKLF